MFSVAYHRYMANPLTATPLTLSMLEVCFQAQMSYDIYFEQMTLGN